MAGECLVMRGHMVVCVLSYFLSFFLCVLQCGSTEGSSGRRRWNPDAWHEAEREHPIQQEKFQAGMRCAACAAATYISCSCNEMPSPTNNLLVHVSYVHTCNVRDSMTSCQDLALSAKRA